MADGSRPVTLLICDDHRVLTDALAIVVGLDDGLELVAPPSQDPGSAIALCAEFLPDVIIIDAESPTRDVLEHVSAVSASNPRPIVLFTEDRDNATIQAAVGGEG